MFNEFLLNSFMNGLRPLVHIHFFCIIDRVPFLQKQGQCEFCQQFLNCSIHYLINAKFLLPLS